MAAQLVGRGDAPQKVERQEQEIELRLRAEAALDEATKRCEELRRALETIERRLSEGQGNQPWSSCAVDLEIVREALRSTPAAKTLRCERCGYCRGEVVCTHCGTPATSSGLSEADTLRVKLDECRKQRDSLIASVTPAPVKEEP